MGIPEDNLSNKSGIVDGKLHSNSFPCSAYIQQSAINDLPVEYPSPDIVRYVIQLFTRFNLGTYKTATIAPNSWNKG